MNLFVSQSQQRFVMGQVSRKSKTEKYWNTESIENVWSLYICTFVQLFSSHKEAALGNEDEEPRNWGYQNNSISEAIMKHFQRMDMSVRLDTIMKIRRVDFTKPYSKGGGCHFFHKSNSFEQYENPPSLLNKYAFNCVFRSLKSIQTVYNERVWDRSTTAQFFGARIYLRSEFLIYSIRWWNWNNRDRTWVLIHV